MTIKLFQKIKKTIDDILLDFPNIIDEREVIYYNCYLIYYGIRNGFYPKVFNNIDAKILNKIRKIPNLDYIKCRCNDSVKSHDIIYIYNKNKYDLIKKSIEYLNKTERTNKNQVKIDSNIANILSYDKIKQNKNKTYNETNALEISFIIHDYRDKNNIKKIKILSYESYKYNLIKNYEKLQKINNLPIFDRYRGLRCILEIDDIGM